MEGGNPDTNSVKHAVSRAQASSRSPTLVRWGEPLIRAAHKEPGSAFVRHGSEPAGTIHEYAEWKALEARVSAAEAGEGAPAVLAGGRAVGIADGRMAAGA